HQPALYSWCLVLAEVDTTDPTEDRENLSQLVVSWRDGGLAKPRGVADIGVRVNMRQMVGDFLRRENQVDHSRRNRRSRPPVVLRCLRRLGDRDATGRLDLADARGAIRGRPRKNDANGTVLRPPRKRLKKEVDWRKLRSIVWTGQKMKGTMRDDHLHIWRNHVHVTRFDRQALRDLDDGQCGPAGQQAWERTFMLRRQMLN